MVNKKLLIGLVVVIVIITSIFLINRSNDIAISEAHGENIAFPYIQNSNLYYFSGSGFNKFNVKTGNQVALTPDYIYPDITQIKWSERGALFSSSSYKVGDSFYDSLQQKQLSSDVPYWWYADFNTGSIQQVINSNRPQEATFVVWRNDSGGFYVVADNPDDGGYKATVHFYDSIRKNRTDITTYEGSQIIDVVWADSQSLLYESKDSNQYKLNKLHLKSGRSETLLESILPGTSVSADGNTALYYAAGDVQKDSHRGNPDSHLTFINFKTKVTASVIKKFTGTTTRNESLKNFNVTGIYKGEPLILVIDDTGKQRRIDAPPETEFSYIYASGTDSFIASGVDKKLYYLAKKLDKNSARLPVSLKIDNLKDLKNYGVSQHQVNGFEYLVKNYFKAQQSNIARVSVDPGSIKLAEVEQKASYAEDTLLFTLSTNEGSRYTASLNYIGINRVKVQLHNLEGKKVIDSEVFDITRLQVK